MTQKPSRNELEKLLNLRAGTDPKFKAKLLQSPKECLAELCHLDIPSHAKIYVHEEDENSWHLVLRKIHPDQLSEKEMEKLFAAGWFEDLQAETCGCS